MPLKTAKTRDSGHESDFSDKLLGVDEIISILEEHEIRISVLENNPNESTMEKQYLFDVFISYSHKDIYWMQSWLLPQLENTGIKACIDYRGFRPGASNIIEMQEAVIQSRRTLLVITPNYIESEWAEFENILAQSLDPAARERRLIPILREACELPLRIRGLTYVDFSRPENVEQQFERLLNSFR